MTKQITFQQLKEIKSYIKQTWKHLQRDNRHLLEAARDEKINHPVEIPWKVYVSRQENYQDIKQKLQQILSSETFSQIELKTLPAQIHDITEHGLLYLPGSYIVPGGRFNEMYGWDSYFIILGLLKDQELELAKSQVEQLIYQIEHYGVILNANRTYMLTRSQPPILTGSILSVFRLTQNHAWLKSTLPAIEQYYQYWITPPHLNLETGLSRYFDLGEGAAPEVLASEKDAQGKTHYQRILEYYQTVNISDYDLNLYYDSQQKCLTKLCYKGDRSMRESGFDPSNRFGPFNIDIIHYVPVCLNALLYKMEQETAQIYQILGNFETAKTWQNRAQNRRELINQFLWDETVGLYFDYNFRTQQRRPYFFATTFYPLWAGLAEPQQAQRVISHLPEFEAPGGLLTSPYVTGNQWDAPFGWAALQLIAVQGLQRYGYDQEARRIAQKFIAVLVQEFDKYGTLFEKYDVVNGSAQVSDEIQFGYSTNEIGFGWTNAVFLELLTLFLSS